MPTHFFQVKIAEEYGVNAAILLENIYFWVEKNRANEQHFHDGCYWTYNSTKAYMELFPYMSKKQVEYNLSKLKKCGLIIDGNYNKLPFDRTKWYTLTEKGRNVIEGNAELNNNKVSNNAFPKMEQCISQNGAIDVPVLGNDISQNGPMTFPKMDQPIPDIIPDINTDIIYNPLTPCAAKEPAKRKSKPNPVEINTDLFNQFINKYSFSEQMREKIFDWFMYKAEMKKDFKERGAKSLFTEIANNVHQYGEDAVIGAINKSMSNGYQGIVWDYCKETKNNKSGSAYIDAINNRYDVIGDWLKDTEKGKNNVGT